MAERGTYRVGEFTGTLQQLQAYLDTVPLDHLPGKIAQMEQLQREDLRPYLITRIFHYLEN